MVDRKSKIYKSMCYKVRRRDKNKCQNPKCVGGCKYTEVHHILPVSLYPNLAYEEKNCCVLCKKCHELVTGKEMAYAPLLQTIVMAKYVKKNKIAEFLGLKYGKKI